MVLKAGRDPADPCTMTLEGDRGDIVLGWLTKLVAVLAVLGVVAFDAISLGAARFSVEDDAQTAARAAVASYRDSKDVQRAYDAALAEVSAAGSTIDAPTFVVGPDGSITLTVRTTAPTLLLEKVAPLRDWAETTATVTGRPAR